MAAIIDPTKKMKTILERSVQALPNELLKYLKRNNMLFSWSSKVNPAYFFILFLNHR